MYNTAKTQILRGNLFKMLILHKLKNIFLKYRINLIYFKAAIENLK